MKPEFMLDPLPLMLEGVFRAIQMLATIFWSLPLWTMLLLVAMAVAQRAWPALFCDTGNRQRRYRR